jgi:hypothetical protein
MIPNAEIRIHFDLLNCTRFRSSIMIKRCVFDVESAVSCFKMNASPKRDRHADCDVLLKKPMNRHAFLKYLFRYKIEIEIFSVK